MAGWGHNRNTLFGVVLPLSPTADMPPHVPTAAMCHLLTHAPQQNRCLFNHLVGGREQRLRHGKTEHPRYSRVDDELELGRLQDRQVGGLRTLEDAASVDTGLPIGIVDVDSVADQTAGLDGLSRRKRCWNRMTGRQGGKLHAPDREEGIRADEQRVGLLARQSCERRIYVATAADIEDSNMQPYRASCGFRLSRV